jgi:glycosyltransferase involved in cell wall biosynthesis
MKDYIFVKIGNPIILENRKKHLDYVNTNWINAVFIENLSIESLEKFYLIADIYLNVSLFEWFWRTLIEAESYDLPILSTNNSGMKEVLKWSPIIIEDWFDKYEIKEKLQKVLYDEKLKKDLIVFWRKNIKRFFVENNVKKWEEILD